ncbi:CPBP family intramembrane glutamic endopeptidase [Paenibacillus sp. GCM10028914]|uniref:CPBP family intramembrane glutamic endopeptidase n=1 Tax=Paenibacillus sp. GCM10028914 TaxID=3273416 RepID=UPI0036087774
MFEVLILSLLLTFSYKFVEIGIKSSKILQNYSIYFWAVIIMIVVPFYKDNYIFSLPANIMRVMPIFLVIVFANYLLSRFSGYNPVGKFNIINFIIVYPIIEELIFRGLILPSLNQNLNSGVFLEVMYMPVTVPVIISALLFAISHLQYYGLSLISIRYMVFAFFGGIVFGAITDLTESILLSCILHIEFNALAVYFANKSRLR